MPEKPRVFIASSAEATAVAEAVSVRLEREVQIKLWENAFNLSSLTLPSLLAKAGEVEFAIFVFHSDDQVFVRGNLYSVVRDNVLFELGLFMGRLGLQRCFLLVPKSAENDFRLPTDLAGLTVAIYDDTIDDMVEAVTISCAKVKQSIRKIQAADESGVSSDSPSESADKNLDAVQSDLWRTRIELQRAVEEQSRLQNAIAAHFFSIAKPATEKEIDAWEEGAKGSYAEIPRISRHQAFFVDRDVILPRRYGAQSISVIVAPGVRVLGLDEWSHNSVYLMDGFRMFNL